MKKKKTYIKLRGNWKYKLLNVVSALNSDKNGLSVMKSTQMAKGQMAKGQMAKGQMAKAWNIQGLRHAGCQDISRK